MLCMLRHQLYTLYELIFKNGLQWKYFMYTSNYNYLNCIQYNSVGKRSYGIWENLENIWKMFSWKIMNWSTCDEGILYILTLTVEPWYTEHCGSTSYNSEHNKELSWVSPSVDMPLTIVKGISQQEGRSWISCIQRIKYIGLEQVHPFNRVIAIWKERLLYIWTEKWM